MTHLMTKSPGSVERYNRLIKKRTTIHRTVRIIARPIMIWVVLFKTDAGLWASRLGQGSGRFGTRDLSSQKVLKNRQKAWSHFFRGIHIVRPNEDNIDGKN